MTFASCGLNAENNFLQAPICRCGCGGYGDLVLDTKQDLYDLIYTLLNEYDCEHCAIFAVCLDNTIVMGAKLSDGIKIYTSEFKEKSKCYTMIAWTQEDFEFHCYGLIEQIDVDTYRIVMK